MNTGIQNDSSGERPDTFVFFHVGDDITIPSMLAKSIRWSNPDSVIVFCTDKKTPNIAGVSRRVEIDGDRSKLMTYRLEAFAKCGVAGAAIYLDTDMLVLRQIHPRAILGNQKIAMCQRNFSRDAGFNGNFRNLDFREYHGRPLGEVYPYVACCTITKTPAIWADLEAILRTLNPKFHLWYGDQEALRIYAERQPQSIVPLPERIYGCLPEANEHVSTAAILHFKGPARKPFMKAYHERMAAANL
jgi:hypothetical protein